MVVLLVNLEMLREIVDPRGKQGHLDIGRTGVLLVQLELLHQRSFFATIERHLNTSIFSPRSTQAVGDSASLEEG
jgi:hypothetical protein